MNTSQIFFGICQSLDHKTSNGGTSYSILRLSAPEAYKKRGETEAKWFDIEFTVFGRVANSVKSHFKEGATAAVWYDLGTRTRGQYTNVNLSVRRVLIFDEESAKDGPRTASNPRQDSTPQKDVSGWDQKPSEYAATAPTTQDDDHLPF